MKKILTIIAIMFCACATPERADNSHSISRFVVVEEAYRWKVVYDKETLVMYAVSDGAYNIGTFTLLVDAEGKPLKWKGGEK